ncbi:hypothetical protein V9T40_007646 [Parthenolecanium corni]|uniref:Ig-like domain-containing protein n=1 Tax=Parthenolecanium corni TaxID=536013 RepID=A0AAN9TJS5_9HEMI
MVTPRLKLFSSVRDSSSSSCFPPHRRISTRTGGWNVIEGYAESEAVAGGVAMLSCNITPPMRDDTVYLVIWYKDGHSSPIYSYDSRDKSLKEASHWSDDKTVGGRVSFELGSKLYPARLTLQAVKDSDGGLYRCRVDFKKSPTRNHNVNLTVLRK